jgi:tetratricopeptide (TPR) repeat protein
MPDVTASKTASETQGPAHGDGRALFERQPQAPAPNKTVTVFVPLTEKPGDRIARYKLLQQIGEGGCGVVYMAEQEQPVRRRVALKVIKLGMDTKQVVARFEAERQALALMDHPNIAKVLDAGATETGRPYFVMELVRGIKITDYCDDSNLATHERLELFAQICHAIHHAHQKGVIHRDIKPSNILVTVNDGVPVPKVIDFGIAKATAGRLTDKTLFTAFEQFIGTPAYMSPEQSVMTSLDIDTRSDIYSLGVLLYELLTSKTPFDSRALLKAGLDEMRRIIREEEPQRPSTRLSTFTEADLATVAKHHKSAAPKLLSMLRGDLDWIVMKALEKDRTRRYESASAFAQDIQHHLNHEPVAAAAPSALYKFRKFARRNKVALVTVTAFASVVMAGAIISAGLAVRATRAEKKAKSEASKSRQVAQFLKDTLDGVGPSVALGRDTAMLREILDKTAERVGSDMKHQPEVEAELRSTVGNTYFELGEYGKAEAMEREELSIRKKLAGKEDPDVARVLNKLALVLERRGRLTEAEATDREALAMQRRLLGNWHSEVASSLDGLANVLYQQGKLAECESVHREALAMRRKLLGSKHLEVAQSLHNLGNVLWGQGKLSEAETRHREALAMRRELLGDAHPDLAQSLQNLALVLLNQPGKLAEAENMIGEALTLQRKLLGKEHPDVANSLSIFAGLRYRQGKLTEAESMHREALSMRRKLLGNEHPGVAQSLQNLALVLQYQPGKLPEAETMIREALAMERKLLGNEHLDVATSLSIFAGLRYSQGNLTEAETMHREALAIQRKRLGDTHPDVAQSLQNLALDLVHQPSKLAEAAKVIADALTMQRKLLGNEHPDVANSLSIFADLRYRQDKLSEAETMHREVLAMRRKLLGNEHPDVAVSIYNLATVLQRQSKLEESEQVLSEGIRGPLGGTLVRAALLRSRANARARGAHWKEAAADLARVVELNATEHWSSYQLGPLLVQCGDTSAYANHRQAMLARFGTTEDAPIAERTAKMCLLLPVAGVDLAASSRLAESAVTVGKSNAWVHYFEFTKSLAEYRQGRFAGAVEWGLKALDTPLDKHVAFRDVQACAVLAMAQHQLHHLDEASAALAKAKGIAETKLRKLDSGDIGDSWHDWLIAHILLREAETLIAGDSATSPPAK